MKNAKGQVIGTEQVDEAVEKARLQGLTACIEYAREDNDDDPEVDPVVWRVYKNCKIIAEMETDAELLDYLNAHDQAGR